MLTRTLRAKIEELNPGLPATAYEDAVRRIVTVSASQTLAATNPGKLHWKLPRKSDCSQFLPEKMTRQQLKEALGLKDDEHFRKAYLLPALEVGLIEMTIPDKPRSSNGNTG